MALHRFQLRLVNFYRNLHGQTLDIDLHDLLGQRIGHGFGLEIFLFDFRNEVSAVCMHVARRAHDEVLPGGLDASRQLLLHLLQGVPGFESGGGVEHGYQILREAFLRESFQHYDRIAEIFDVFIGFGFIVLSVVPCLRLRDEHAVLVVEIEIRVGDVVFVFAVFEIGVLRSGARQGAGVCDVHVQIGFVPQENGFPVVCGMVFGTSAKRCAYECSPKNSVHGFVD